MAETGLDDREFLPLWMRSIQDAASYETGYVKALPLCFCKPGTAVNVLARIRASEFDFKTIDFVADRLLVSLGCKKHYNATNPFDFMEMISIQGKTNFFEKRVGEYQKAGVLAGDANKEFSMNEEF